MKTKFLISTIAALALAGCATCDRHPVACGVGMAVAIGSVAAVAASHHKARAFGTNAPTSAPGGNLL